MRERTLMNCESFYLRASAAYGLCWSTIVTVNLVFMATVAKLDPLQMVLVGTVLEGAVFLFEVPTGVVADAVSRRLSVIIGHALTGLGFLLLGLFPNFWMILAAQVVWGIGSTFISGAYAAWVSDEVGVGRAGNLFLRASQWRQAGGALGIVASVALAQVSLALPIIVGSCGFLAIVGAMIAWMPETGFKPVPPEDRTTWQVMGQTFRAGLNEFRIAPLLGTIVVITAIYGAFSEGMDRLFTPFLLGHVTFPPLGPLNSVAWWGVIAMISTLVALLSTSLARRFVTTTSHRGLTIWLGLFTAAIGVAVAVMANMSGFVGVLVFYWLATGLRVARGPLMTIWLNRHLPSHSRATILSLVGQADAVGQTMGGPVVGFVAREISIAAALTISALLLAPAVLLYRMAASIGERATSAAPTEG
jgi:DHA3 family tetracycline resistance protein-like MFS transporter